MDRSNHPAEAASPILARASYAALRYEGLPPLRAQIFLGLSEAVTARLERLFRAQTGDAADPMKPRFARHAAHVAAVMAQGGFPVLTR